ncbi:MAG: ISL3 family transposase [Bacillota bacterium]|nr:ISL3 family transposase [Bacillota bacterium]
MRDIELFQQALDAECGATGCAAYDTTDRSWRRLNCFQHEALLHARVPRVECPSCGVKQVEVPWARPGSGFTLLFEALVMAMVKQMPVQAVGRLVGETDKRLWRILNHYVEGARARARADFSNVREVGVDEPASKRGHNYVSFYVSLERRRLLFGTEGREGDALGRFRLDLMAHGGAAERIRELCMDMSPAYIRGAERHFPLAEVTFDRFHVKKLFNEAIEKVRREEQKERPELKKTRWLWLKNQKNLTKSQATDLAVLLEPSRIALKTAKAYQMKLAFEEFWELPPILATAFLTKWRRWPGRSKMAPMVKLAATLRDHQRGLLRWFHSRISNGTLESVNSLVQAAKARARGYRTSQNLITMAYLISADLDYELPI